MVFSIFRRKKKPTPKPVEPKIETPKEEPAPIIEDKTEDTPPEPQVVPQIEKEPEPAPKIEEPSQSQGKTPEKVQEAAPEKIQDETPPKDAPEEVQEEKPEPPKPPAPKKKEGFFSRLKSGLTRTRQTFNSDVKNILKTGAPITEDLFDELEELLVTSDLGIEVAMDMMDRIRRRSKKLSYAAELRAVLKEELLSLFPKESDKADEPVLAKPHVIMMVGVNGTGKTTTLGKMATQFTREGKKVLIVAADTFRAAAVDQVAIWAERSGSDIVKHREGADPAAVAYDGMAAAIARKVDIVLVDTAGRLHTQKNLMEELKKIKRTIQKKLKGAPHEVLMVLDATTGQNAVSQAKIFHNAVGLTQLALTKLDGTAKGGIAGAVAASMDLPIRYIGVGEGIDDLQDFDAQKFIDAMFDD